MERDYSKNKRIGQDFRLTCRKIVAPGRFKEADISTD
jgi:hypothetical protein